MTVATATPEPPVPALVLDIPEAAALLRCGRSMIYTLIAAEEITSIKIGRRRLVTHESLTAYVQRRAAAQQAADEGLPVLQEEGTTIDKAAIDKAYADKPGRDRKIGDAQFEEAS